ncbi:MAG TPA: 23S rRNA (pseudouridine(1915)-N(3))-methyltransferase RlmH [Parachlamydiaceae bacterium]|nr:23S rRNA (pseudouridine(1915)-N(3))-methyltransferase RlmH [Parachlamydiaceae bacterium]
MLKLKILSIGKTKEEWLESALNEYMKRLKPILSIEFLLARSDEELLSLAEKEPLLVCLDPKGKKMDSAAFANYIQNKFVEGGSKLAIAIGGAEGLPEKLKSHKNLISFSDLTMTHQIVRLVLIEQIYRAFEIMKGSKYHK